jgi:hypothetical protein
MSYFKLPLAALAALLLAGPVTHAQQASAATTGKVKTKTKRTQAAATNAALAPDAAGAALAPPPPPAGAPLPGGPGRPEAGGPGRPGGPGPRKGGAQALTDFTGTLTDYTAANDDQVYDAFTLKTSTGTETVRFPRHQAKALMAAAKAGSQVTVSGFRDTDPEGRTVLHLVSLTAGGQTVRDTPPTPPTTPPTEEATTVRGTVQRLAQGPNGRTNALVMSDGTIVRLSPDAAEQLAEKLKVGATVAAAGTLRASAPGEVAAKPVRVVRAQTITLDGVQFLVR